MSFSPALVAAWACFALHIFSKRGCRLDTATLKSCSMFSWDLYFVFSEATAEQPILQRYHVAKGRRMHTALCPMSGYSLSTPNQNSQRVWAVNLSLRVESRVESLSPAPLGYCCYVYQIGRGGVLMVGYLKNIDTLSNEIWNETLSSTSI